MVKFKHMKLLILTLLVLIATWIIWSAITGDNLESPEYTVLEEHQGYEIRQYQPYIIAQATVSSSNPSIGSAFRVLAAYIFGGNTSNQNIAMTAPVATETAGESIAMTAPVATEKTNDGLTMSFMMPSQFTLENLPKPNSENISFKKVPAGKFAVLSFSGIVSEKIRLKKTEELRRLLRKDAIEFENKTQLLQYDQPLVFPLLRTNEIKIEIISTDES